MLRWTVIIGIPVEMMILATIATNSSRRNAKSLHDGSRDLVSNDHPVTKPNRRIDRSCKGLDMKSGGWSPML
jgi:hypothetical protein